MLNKKVIVTGGTYGIGESVVKALVAEGAEVASVARGAELGEKSARELSAKGPGNVAFFQCDVSEREQVKSAFAAAVKQLNGLDALVHVAAIEHAGKAEL